MASTDFAPRLLYYGLINVTPDIPSYGDHLRQRNVIVAPEGRSMAQLINFDWVRKEDKDKHLLSVSSSVDWPEGVQGLAYTQKEHDLAMLDSGPGVSPASLQITHVGFLKLTLLP